MLSDTSGPKILHLCITNADGVQCGKLMIVCVEFMWSNDGSECAWYTYARHGKYVTMRSSYFMNFEQSWIKILVRLD